MSEKDTEVQESSQENPNEKIEVPTTKSVEEATKGDAEAKLADVEEKNRQLFERTKKAEEAVKEARAELEDYKVNYDSGSEESSNDDELRQKVVDLETQVAEGKAETALQNIYSQHKALKEKDEEFREYVKEHKNYSIDDAAKLFMVDHDLISTPKRKGLEKPTGGSQATKTPGTMTSAEAKDLRENNFRQYQKMLNEGTLKIKD